MTAPDQEHRLVTHLRALDIDYAIHRHPALHTVAESKRLRGILPGAHIKNLFLRDKKRAMWLVTVLEDRDLDLKQLRPAIGARGNLSFASAQRLEEALGVTPGAVTPLAVINDPEQRVQLILDKDLLAQGPINAHPLHNQATIAIDPADLLRFIAACGHQPRIMDFAGFVPSQP